MTPLSQIHLFFFAFFSCALRLHLYSLHKRLGQGTPSLMTGKDGLKQRIPGCVAGRYPGENSPVEVGS